MDRPEEIPEFIDVGGSKENRALLLYNKFRKFCEKESEVHSPRNRQDEWIQGCFWKMVNILKVIEPGLKLKD